MAAGSNIWGKTNEIKKKKNEKVSTLNVLLTLLIQNFKLSVLEIIHSDKNLSVAENNDKSSVIFHIIICLTDDKLGNDLCYLVSTK